MHRAAEDLGRDLLRIREAAHLTDGLGLGWLAQLLIREAGRVGVRREGQRDGNLVLEKLVVERFGQAPQSELAGRVARKTENSELKGGVCFFISSVLQFFTAKL